MQRILDISNGPARLSVRHRQLVISSEDRETTVPVEETLALIVSAPGVVYTQAVLSELCSAGAAFVLCDEKHFPTGMLLPLAAHYTQTERFAAQVTAKVPLKKRLWRQIIQAKVRAQGRLVEHLCDDDWGITAMARRVRSGDTTNVEAQAARRYWPALFGDAFRRDPVGPPPNGVLNYGYAVLRAIVTRAICAVGLHPSIGLHHHNRYNPFCLADDLMEPLRPVVDEAVARVCGDFGSDIQVTKEAKALLLDQVCLRHFRIGGEARQLTDIAARIASSLASAFAGETKKLFLPPLQPDDQTA